MMSRNFNRKSVIVKIILCALALILTAVILVSVFFALAFLYHPTHCVKYSDDDYIVTLDAGDDDFVILNLTDIQLCDLEDIDKFDAVKARIDELVARTNPDLITITGDMTWSNENNISIHFIIKTLESYGIPWAPVLGNHDLGNDYNTATASGDYLIYLFESAEHCLFRHGPRELGIGNYIVKIMRGDELYKVLYFMDNGYIDEITDAQKNWLIQNYAEIYRDYGFVEGALFMHKPISEYFDAYVDYAYDRGNVTAIGDVYVDCSLYGVYSNGLFDLLKEINVQDVVVGHQHSNAFTIEYEGVRLTFGVKTTETSFFLENDEVYLNGGTLITFTGDDTEVEMVLANR